MPLLTDANVPVVTPPYGSWNRWPQSWVVRAALKVIPTDMHVIASRLRSSHRARTLFVGIMAEYTNLSLPDMARMTQRKHHSVVADALARFQQLPRTEREKILFDALVALYRIAKKEA